MTEWMTLERKRPLARGREESGRGSTGIPGGIGERGRVDRRFSRLHRRAVPPFPFFMLHLGINAIADFLERIGRECGFPRKA